MQIRKVISGGQTGVDQAALRASVASGIPIAGWCPPGRTCEDGVIPEEFPLRVCLDPGTNFARQCSFHFKKPCAIEDPSEPLSQARSRKWIEENSIAMLNVAGPSEKTQPGIGQLVYIFLMELLG